LKIDFSVKKKMIQGYLKLKEMYPISDESSTEKDFCDYCPAEKLRFAQT